MHLSNRKIAEGLGKSHQKIHNKIKRGLVDLTFTDCGLKYSVEVISKLPNMPSYKTIYN